MAIEALHPSAEELTAFVSGQLPRSEAGEIERHLDQCQKCSETLSSLSTDDTFVGLLKQAVNPDNGLATGMSHLDIDTAFDAAKDVLTEHSRYEIVELIAQGGMGQVFKATHRMMDRTVALKVIKNQLMRNTEVIERFHREVKAAAQLSHPNIVTAHDAEQANGVHFLVMEYAEGTTLSELVKRDGPLPVAQACDYVRQVAAGLQHAHQQGMVHRDIKPHNLILTTDGTVKILDFGLASLSSEIVAESSIDSADVSLTTAGCVMGTPDFISPEQATDAHQADIRSDIYSLGATLYYLLSGQPPFSNGGVAERLKDHMETAPVPVNQLREEVPQVLADIVDRMLAKDPAQRFGSPKEVESALALLSVGWIPRTLMAIGAFFSIIHLIMASRRSLTLSGSRKTSMNINARWLFGAYLSVAVWTALTNVPVTTVVTKIDTRPTKGATIPLENIASLPAVRDNGGVVPPHVQTAHVEMYAVESHRGWPLHIEKKSGYRYDFINPRANYFATLTEFPNYKGIIWQNLIANFAGTLAYTFSFHMSLILFFRGLNAMNTKASQHQAAG